MYPRGHRLRPLDAGHVRLLTEIGGWTDDDLTALLDDWPGLHPNSLHSLTRFCTDLLGEGANATQVRAWTKALLHTTARGQILAANDTLRAWTTRPGAGRFSDASELVEHYTTATDGDHDLAVLAVIAGMSPEETRTGLATGSLDPDGLRILIGLRR